MLKNTPARGMLAYLNVAFMGFVIATVVARFGYPAVSFEGQSVWMIRSLPIRYRGFLWTKFLMFFLPLLIMTLALMYLSNQLLEIPPFAAYVSLFVITLVTFALTGLGVGLGVAYPRFKYENATQIITGLGGLIFMVLSLIYIGIIVILLAVPGYHYFSYLMTGETYLASTAYLALAAIVCLSLFVGIYPMEVGLKRWNNLKL
jgi:ABC-2 type transport system permease protein